MGTSDDGIPSVIADGAYGKFEGSPRDRVVLEEYRQLGYWAKDLVELITTRLFAGGAGTFIDVGANIGLVCVPVIAASRAHGICFEPEPQNFTYLQRNVARHGLGERITCHPCACHENTGLLPLTLSEDNLGDHRLLRTPAQLEPQTGRRVIQVETRRLDDVLQGRALERPVVMKVDAQGSEVGVFAGAQQTLAQTDFLITEYWPRGIVDHGDNAQAFERQMRQFPYGAVLHVLPLPEPLHPSSYVFDQLRWIAHDGSDPGFFDMLFARHAALPPRARAHTTP
jgi:FkbM family methyltransferase